MIYYNMYVGVPCSGKSTAMKDAKEILEESGEEFVILSTDDYIENYARENGMSYADAFNVEGLFAAAVSDMNVKLNKALEIGKNGGTVVILHDQTNLSRKKRISFLKKFNGPSVIAVAYVFPTINIDIFRERNEKRFAETGKRIPESVFINMINNFEIPEYSEGWDFIDFREGYNGTV